jgi:hypothetical protein
MLTQFLLNHYSDAKFSARCSDGSRLTSDKLEEILEFPNPSFRKIENFEISFDQKSFNDSGEIELGAAGSYTTQLTVRGTDDMKVTHVANEVSRQLAELRPAYWLIMKLRPSIVLWAALISYLVVVNWVYVLATGKRIESPVGMSGFISLIYVLIPVLLVLAAAVLFLDKAWDWLFPKAWFLIGRQSREFERRAAARKFVFIAIGASIVVGVASNYVYSLVTRR